VLQGLTELNPVAHHAALPDYIAGHTTYAGAVQQVLEHAVRHFLRPAHPR